MSRRELESLQISLKRTFNQLGYRVTDTELKLITKNSRNYEFWGVIQKLVLPGDDIKNIRLRLAAYHRAEESRALSTKLEALKEQSEELQNKLDSTLCRNDKIKRSIISIKSKIVEDVKEQCKLEADVKAGNMKGVLQRAVLLHCNNLQAKLRENGNVIDERTKHYLTVSNSYQDTKTFYSCDDTVQSECTLSLQNILSKLSLYNSKTHVTNDLDAVARANLSARIADNVRDIQDRYSPVEILSSVCEITQSETTRLKNSSDKMDISHDMRELELLMKDGRITERDKKIEPNKSLDCTVLCLKEKVRKEFITQLQHTNETKQLRVTQHVLLAEIDAEVRALPWDGNDKTLLSALIKFQIRLEELESKEVTLNDIMAKLSREKEEALLLKNATLDKYHQINTFKRRCEAKQSVIKNLLSHGGALRESVAQSLNKISSFVEEKIKPLKTFPDEIKKIIDYPETLTDTLERLPLNRLLLTYLTTGQSIPVCDLSIYQDYYHGNQTLVHHGSETIDQCMYSRSGMLPYHSPDVLLDKCSDVVCKEHMESLLEVIYRHACNHGNQDGNHGNDHGSGDVLEQLRSSIFEFDTFTSESVLPRIEKYYNRCSTALPKCATIQTMIQEFVDQPGQHLAPWVTVSNQAGNHGNGNHLTLRDVLERWIVRTAQTVSLSQSNVQDDQLIFS